MGPLFLSATALWLVAVSEPGGITCSSIGMVVPAVISTITAERSRFDVEGDRRRAVIVPWSMVTCINGEDSSVAFASKPLDTADNTNTVVASCVPRCIGGAFFLN